MLCSPQVQPPPFEDSCMPTEILEKDSLWQQKQQKLTLLFHCNSLVVTHKLVKQNIKKSRKTLFPSSSCQKASQEDTWFLFAPDATYRHCVTSLSTEIGQNQGNSDAATRREGRISFSRQASQPDPSDSCRTRCPIYIYSCSLELLREQMISPRPDKSLRDIFFR